MNNIIRQLIRPSTLIMAIMIFSCGDEHEFIKISSPSPTSGIHVKFIHASAEGLEVTPTSGAKFIRPLNFFVDDTKVSSTISYGTAFPVTGYTVLSVSDAIDIKAPLTAATATVAELPAMDILTSNVSLAANGFFTVALIGPLAARETLVITDDQSQIPIDGQAYIRVMNFIHNSTNGIMLVATPPKDKPEDPTPAPITLVEKLNYKEVSGFIALPKTGVYTSVQLKDAVTGTVLTTYTAANSTFAANKVYSLYGRGQLGLGSSDPKRALYDRLIYR